MLGIQRLSLVAMWCALAYTQLQADGASIYSNPYQVGSNGNKFLLNRQHPAVKGDVSIKHVVVDNKGKPKEVTHTSRDKPPPIIPVKQSTTATTKPPAKNNNNNNNSNKPNDKNKATPKPPAKTTAKPSMAPITKAPNKPSTPPGTKTNNKAPPPTKTAPKAVQQKAPSKNSTRQHRQLEQSSPHLERLQGFFDNVAVNLNQLPSQANADTAPWPGSYWPSYKDGINDRWNEGDKSPSEKYAKAFGLNEDQFTEAISRSTGILRVGPDKSCANGCSAGSECVKRANMDQGLCVPTWYGICHAWSTAAIMEPEPKCAVDVNGVHFEPKDIKGLVSQMYVMANVPTVFIGARYDGGNDAVDEYGRFVDAAKRDIGPGLFHICMGNILGIHGKTFIIDADPGLEVWNQPIRGYNVVEQENMTPQLAAQRFFNKDQYPFNPNAKSLEFIRNQFSYILESNDNDPKVSTGQIDAFTKTEEYTYLLELDDDDNIIGGEWVGESRAKHPDYLWFPANKLPQGAFTDVGLSYDLVSSLVQKSQSGC